MTNIIMIHTNGDVKKLSFSDNLINAAADFFECTSIVTLHNKEYIYVIVGAIDDFGATKRLPVNIKAWYLYGRSPIHGDMLLARDDGKPLDEELIELISQPWETWFIPEAVQNMKKMLDELNIEDVYFNESKKE